MTHLTDEQKLELREKLIKQRPDDLPFYCHCSGDDIIALLDEIEELRKGIRESCGPYGYAQTPPDQDKNRRAAETVRGWLNDPDDELEQEASDALTAPGPQPDPEKLARPRTLRQAMELVSDESFRLFGLTLSEVQDALDFATKHGWGMSIQNKSNSEKS